MNIERLEIQQFRNIHSLRLSLHPQFNVFYGQNGSGKTSILEAIYYLGFGRSFRTHLANRVIEHGQDKLSIFAQTSETALGVERAKNGTLRLRLDKQDIDSISEIVKELPLQIIYADTYQLLDAGPKYRRQFIDWGLFHVEQNYLKIWRNFQRILKQRNAALRSNLSVSQITLWDKSLVETARLITSMRQQYLELFVPIFKQILNSFLEIEGLNISYYIGWNEEKSLEQALMDSLQRDLLITSTQVGPQRADLKMSINKIPAEAILSRGQQKLFVCAMRLAQGVLLKKQAQKNCVYLIDDLPAELDAEKRKILCEILATLQAQILLTTVEKSSLEYLTLNNQGKLFHVEQGSVKEI